MIFDVGDEVEDEEGVSRLQSALREAEWPDDRPLFNVPVAAVDHGLLRPLRQCVSTLAVIRRETNSWAWPAFSFAYMTALAYVGALLTYQVGILIARLRPPGTIPNPNGSRRDR